MKLIRILLLTILSTAQILAQDIHWSQFTANPLFLNPANTGHFNGDIRLNGNWKDQWRSVSKPYQTLSASADFCALKNRNFGYGGLLFHDVSGDGQFRTIELQGNVAYTIKLKSDSSQLFRPGLNLGVNHRQINWDQLTFDNQFNGMSFDPSLPSNESYATDSKTNLSFGVGLLYEYIKNSRKKVTAGMSLFNINRPNQGFYTTVVPRDVRFNVFGNAIYKLNPDYDLVPSLQLSIQGKYRELVMGGLVKNTLKNRLGEYLAVYGGLFYRNKDAAIVRIAMDYNQWKFGVSYDVNFSKLVPASHVRGGLELSIQYILYRFKPSKQMHRICPDYI